MKKQTYDYIIVGQGLAGTILSYILLKKGKSVYVLNKTMEGAAYPVSAGLFNPVTGKRMTKTWMAEELFPFLQSFYTEFEDFLNEKLIYNYPVFKPFSSTAEQNEWLTKAFDNGYEDFVSTEIPKTKYQEYIECEAGGFETKQSGYVKVKELVEGFRKYLKEKNLFAELTINPDIIQIADNKVSVNGIEGKKLIFCEGYQAISNPYFSWLPFRPSKGEVLDLQAPDLDNSVIYNKSAFVLPTESGFRAGSTYDNHFSDTKITEKGRSLICERVSGFIKKEVSVTGQVAGIRPAVSDRRPLIGLHPELKTIGIFNGLGTKGVSLAPYFALRFYKHLEEGEKLTPEVDISRFKSLYSGLKT